MLFRSSYQQRIKELVKNTVARTDDQQVSPRVGLNYLLNDQITFYANYAEGFSPLSGTDYAGKAFEPELSESVEVGMKLALASWQATLSLFEAEKANIRGSDPVNVGFSATLGAAQSRGAELELAGPLAANTELSLSYSWLDSETLTDSINIDWGVLVPKGSALVNVPRHTLSAQLRQQLAIAGYDSQLGARLRYQSKRLVDGVRPFYRLPSHSFWSLFASTKLSPQCKARWEGRRVGKSGRLRRFTTHKKKQ